MKFRGGVYSLVIAILVLCVAACSNSSPTSLGGGSTYESGVLVITPLLESTSIESNGATYVLISRSGSLANSATITLQSSNSGVMSVAQSSLSLSSGESSAYVQLVGISVGSAVLTATSAGYNESQTLFTIESAPLFSCVADISGNTPALCGCLNENDGSGLTWYADASQTGTWIDWCTESSSASSHDINCISGYGESLNTFNTVSHCGYSDWHLPQLTATGGAVASAGGQWGIIGTYASNNGSTGSAFATFLGSNGFSSVNTSSFTGFYWSSVYGPNSSAYDVFMSDGNVYYDLAFAYDGVMLVRP